MVGTSHIFSKIVSLAPLPPNITISGKGTYIHNNYTQSSCTYFILPVVLINAHAMYGCMLGLITGQIALGEKTKLLISFVNPLPVQMEDVTLNIDVDGMKEGKSALMIVQKEGELTHAHTCSYIYMSMLLKELLIVLDI